MVYYNSNSKNLIETYLNLEELKCLTFMVDISCAIVDQNNSLQYFDTEGFEIIDAIPENIIRINLSDYVCIFEKDLENMECMDFISYKSHQNVNMFRLDKFFEQDYEVYFNKPNYYESKYYCSDETVYKSAINAGFDFGLNSFTQQSLSFINKILPRQPLLIITPNVVDKVYNFEFEDCYFYSEGCTEAQLKTFFIKNNLKPFDLKNFFTNYHDSFKNMPLFVILIAMIENFNDLYGPSNNYLFGILCKHMIKNNPSYQIKILNELSGGAKKGFLVSKPQPLLFFEFAQMCLNYDRFDVMSLMRFKDHLKDWNV